MASKVCSVHKSLLSAHATMFRNAAIEIMIFFVASQDKLYQSGLEIKLFFTVKGVKKPLFGLVKGDGASSKLRGVYTGHLNT